MAEQIKVEGLTTFRVTMKAAARRVEDTSSPATKTAAFLSSRGRVDAPRRTGRLASSVRGQNDGGDAVVSSALPYSNRTHWGYARYHQRAQPWLTEGRDNTEGAWMRNYENHVQTSLAMVRGA